MAGFDLAQTFFVDPALLDNSATVGISQVDLFFRAKPKIEGNKSGIVAPGVEIFIAETLNGIPIFDRGVTRRARVIVRKEYSTVRISQDCSVATCFKFFNPYIVETGFSYAIMIKFDGSEDYLLWGSTQGENLLGTTTPSPGPSGRYVGKLFSYISPEAIEHDPILSPLLTQDDALEEVANFSETVFVDTIPDAEYLQRNWKPWNDQDLRFRVYVARYAHKGLSVFANSEISNTTIDIHLQSNDSFSETSNGVFRMTAPSFPQEYLTYDRKTSSNVDNILYGDFVYQDQPFFPGGATVSATCNVVSGNAFVTGNASYVMPDSSTFRFDDIFNIPITPEYVVVVSEDHDGAGLDRVNVRRVKQYFTNNGIICYSAFDFTNNAAKFFKSPVGTLQVRTRDFLFGKREDILVLAFSNANDVNRFVNNQIDTITIDTAGTGYANDDYIEIDGFEDIDFDVKGGYFGIANLVTDGSGIITSVNIANAGAGFVNTAAITFTVLDANNDPSGGSSADFSFTTDTILKTEYANAIFKGVKIINLEAVASIPDIDISNPSGTVYTITNRTRYFSNTSSTSLSGKAYWQRDDDSVTDLEVKNIILRNYRDQQGPVLPSRSNEWSIRYANGFSANDSILGKYYSNSSIYFIDFSANNDYTTVRVYPQHLHTIYKKYSINDDYQDEQTNYGNSLAKGVQTKINFAANQFAEDLIVYLTAHKPSNTDVQVYARIHNSNDPESFGDKDWTRMEQTDGVGVISSRTNRSDFKEYTYNFQSAPNTFISANTTTATVTDLTLDGTITTTIDSTTVTGHETDFVTDLAVNDLIEIYQPLFRENYIVGVVATITNTTQIILQANVANNGLVGDGMRMAQVAYPLQAFNNITNDNVCRYYNSSRTEFDTFNSFQIKIVLLSDTDYVVPKIDDCRAVGVSA